jgi:hypothetical protein
VRGGSLVKCSMFAWGCVVWYNVWCDAGGISYYWGDTVTCSAGGDTRAQRGYTQLVGEGMWHYIDVGRNGTGGGSSRTGAKAPSTPDL